MSVYLQRLFILLILAFVFFLLTLLIRVQRRFKKLEREKQQCEQRVEERERDMEAKNRHLETQTANFFSHVSHEFRSHLTLIMLPLEQLLENCRDKEQEEKLDLIMQNSQHLLTLISRLPHLYLHFSQEGASHESV